ncbi:hypothetical protein F10086_166 [Staphylococcus phage vB_SauM_JDF86]|nr:hypothetical protein F10086_166 [Staphylococcus phage vB_SauM_JDF86]
MHKEQGTVEKAESIINEVEEVYSKAKAFDTFLKYKEHVEKYGKQGGNELDKVFESVMEEYYE